MTIKGEQAKKQLIAAALAQFGEYGMNATTREIAAQAGQNIAAIHYYGTHHQDDGVLCYRSPVVAAFVRQRRCCRKHLDNRDEAETEEDNPDYLVAFKYAL